MTVTSIPFYRTLQFLNSRCIYMLSSFSENFVKFQRVVFGYGGSVSPPCLKRNENNHIHSVVF